MPPKRSITLTPAELRLMRVLWSRGESTVADMVAATADERALAYTSVLTTIRILEEKGYARHRRDGARYVYLPRASRKAASRSALKRIVSTFFRGSIAQAMAALLETSDTELSKAELENLQQIINQTKKEGR